MRIFSPRFPESRSADPGRRTIAILGIDLGGRLAVVSDADTYDVLGARVVRALTGRVAVTEVDVTGHFGAELGAACWAAVVAKRFDAMQAG